MAKKNKDNAQALVDETKSGKTILSWMAPEYEYYEKSTDWYWWVGLFAVVLLVFAIWQKSFLFSVLVLLGWFTIVLYAVRPLHMVTFAITERGIVIENKLYFWQDLKSFWIFYNPPLRKDLTITSRRSAMPPMSLHLGDQDPTKVRAIMLKFIPEIEQEESLIDSLARLARF